MGFDSKPLDQLLRGAGLPAAAGDGKLSITGLTDDSREVTPGGLFVAVRGQAADGHRFIPEAVRRGAAAVVLESGAPVPGQVRSIVVPDSRPVLARLAAGFFGGCGSGLRIVGVTGTNGKTTVTWMIEHLLSAAGVSCGVIGSIGVRWSAVREGSGNTTPGAVTLHRLFSRMRADRVAACAMEVSSHALDQQRTAGIPWAAAVFTNLTADHLDYHKTREAYGAAKRRLFEELPAGAAAVINREDPAWESFREAARRSDGKRPILTYGFGAKADLTVEQLESSMSGSRGLLKTGAGSHWFDLPLIGRHNVENLLAAAAVAIALKVPLDPGLTGLKQFGGVPGRLEAVRAGQPFPVFVDYAHTEDSLRRTLEQLRQAHSGKILVVFGCGGDRDRTKRAPMGRAASEGAERVILTSDNPRGESPESIAREVEGGLAEGKTPWKTILDRRAAIAEGLREAAGPDWLVLVAGKGHETTQEIQGRREPFDDRAVIRELLAGRVGAG
ncbi:MAG: UDP-N-acetylmuramoyl-L-alanyl-D-glutamate--2,6-diaminopimelate ligase [Candidatus Omnitrophica bacterium CG11_big_fil_rev_8_21_14_0_20_64_10]|nr:MAG: UDP-N-acetylmuramoyl-L-alanyl-D-glutamate--2,6-diaminopimelate ligase [Candidatus Omnitrophica bacterium CG11_big_fil_rev_8_21_14_0_20_64_10]